MTEQRLIDANELTDRLNHTTMVAYPNLFPGLLAAVEIVDDSPTVDAVTLPCKIGDTVWGVRRYRGILVPQQGKVSEMLFTPDMELSIVVRHICRGKWGKKVFATREAAERAIAERWVANV